METVLIVVTVVLTSTVLSTLITGILSLHMKRKELEVKLRLEEKNKWIENINKAQKDYIESLTEAMKTFMESTFDLISAPTISTKVNALTTAHNTLLFFLYQSEYSSALVEEIREVMKKNMTTLNKYDRISMDYKKRLKLINQQESSETLEGLQNKFRKVVEEIEKELGISHYVFSEKLGTMVRVEKNVMNTEIINRSFLNNLLSLENSNEQKLWPYLMLFAVIFLGGIILSILGINWPILIIVMAYLSVIVAAGQFAIINGSTEKEIKRDKKITKWSLYAVIPFIAIMLLLPDNVLTAISNYFAFASFAFFILFNIKIIKTKERLK